MSEGELLQIEKARKLNIDEPVYFEIIRQKTASLIASCCSCGAASATEDQELIAKMRLFGEKTGIAFQIRDDLFDYGSDKVGKPLGIDIREKKMTLPLIYSLNQASWAERRKAISIVRNHGDNKQKVAWVLDFVKRSGGMDYSVKVMEKYVQEAREIIHEFPDSPSRNSILQMIDYTIERTN